MYLEPMQKFQCTTKLRSLMLQTSESPDTEFQLNVPQRAQLIASLGTTIDLMLDARDMGEAYKECTCGKR